MNTRAYESDPSRSLAERLKSRANYLVAVGALSAVALAGCASSEVKGTESTPAISASSTPEASPSAAPEIVYSYSDPHEFDVPLDASPEQLGEIYAAFATAQAAGNVNEQSIDALYEFDEFKDMTQEEYAMMRAQENVGRLFDAQMVPDWREREDLLGIYNWSVRRNAANIQNWQNDSFSDSLSLTDVTVTPRDDGGLVATITLTEHLSADWESARKNIEKLDGNITVEQVTYVPVDGRLLIANYQAIS